MSEETATGRRSSAMEPIEILVVEDNPADVRLIEEALSEGRIANEIHVVEEGHQAMRFLRRGAKDQGPQADLILLDLNMPGMSGHELLARLQEDPELKEIPAVVLTTSEDQADLRESYRLQAAGFITKPVDPHVFLSTVHELGLYWVCVVKLPDEG